MSSRVLLLALVPVAVAVACSDPPPPPKDSGPPVVCCPPTPQPECCMQVGGAQFEGVCPDLTCDIPDPATPGWQIIHDSDGCARWSVPAGPFACGAPPVTPIEAAPPCAPLAVSGYAPAPMTPPRPHTSACTPMEISTFHDACMMQGMSSAACTSFGTSDATCAQCIVSQANDAAWGPVVVGLDGVTLDIPGCIALVQNDAGPTSCAQRASDALGCEAYACDGVCPVTADAGAQARAACIQGAAIDGCHGYVTAQCDTADAGVAACLATVADEAKFAALASVFCGGA